ncbi:MAG: hypothetical protein AAF456_08815 [Planctomycetota bacterium]
MKRFAIVVAALAMACFVGAEQSQAQCVNGGWGGYGVRGTGVSISVGNGYSGFNYSRGYPAYGIGYSYPVRTVRTYSGYGGLGYGGYGGFGYGHGLYNRPGGFYGHGYRRPGCGW